MTVYIDEMHCRRLAIEGTCGRPEDALAWYARWWRKR